MIQIGGVKTTFCHREGILLQKYAIEMGGVSRYFFACIGVRGRFDSPELDISQFPALLSPSDVPLRPYLGNHAQCRGPSRKFLRDVLGRVHA